MVHGVEGKFLARHRDTWCDNTWFNECGPELLLTSEPTLVPVGAA